MIMIKRRWPVIVLPLAMLTLVAGVAYATSVIGTTYTFESGTAEGWTGSTGTAVGYHASPYCIGSYCWFASLTDGTHQYITATYEIEDAGIYVFDGWLKRRGSHRFLSQSDDVDGYGVSSTYVQSTMDTVWYHKTTYMALITGTWEIGHESWGTVTSRTFDHATLNWYGDFYDHPGGLVCDGGFVGVYDDNWDLYDPGGDTYYSAHFGDGVDYGTYDDQLGSMRIHAGDRLTTTIYVPADAGDISLSYRHGWTDAGVLYRLYSWAGALLDSNTNSACGGHWCTRTDTWGSLAAGYYNLVFTAVGEPGFLDSVTVNCENTDVCYASDCVGAGSEEQPAEPQIWNLSAWIYHPYEQADLWSTYQGYTETSWYGGAYEDYTIWRLRPGAAVYPLATLDIVDVGVNGFGYYVDTRINAWPDVPSTTVRYEGLASVKVSAGQRINTDCELGTVGPNAALGQYHLLLYVEYNDTPINPVPYMTRYPDGTMCSVTDSTAETTGPGAGEVPDQILEVCQGCAVPTSWLNVGRWIAWLWCQVQNAFTCWLANWVNEIIVMQVMTLQRIIADADALQVRINDMVYVQVLNLRRLQDSGDWLAGLTTDGVTYTAATWSDLGSRIDNLGYIVMSFAGGNTTYITEEAGTNLWDVLVGLSRLVTGVVDLLAGLIDGAFRVLIILLRLVSNIVNLLVMVITGLITGLAGESEPADLVAAGINISDLTCTEAGAFAASGASPEKAACMFLTMLGLFDSVMTDSLFRLVPLLMVGILAIGLAFWVAGQFRQISAT